MDFNICSKISPASNCEKKQLHTDFIATTGRQNGGYMIIKGKENLQGKENKRQNSVKPTNNEGTAAWQNSETNYKVDQVNKPSIERVIDAKDWVDNGSRL